MKSVNVATGIASMVVLLWTASVTLGTEGELETAKELSNQTGRPLLVVAGTDT